MTRRSGIALAFAAVVVCSFGMSLNAADSNIGTWKLNLVKSTFNPDRKPKSQTLTIQEWGSDGVRYRADGTDADGQATYFEFQANYDGQFVPVKGYRDANMLAFKRVNPNKVESTTRLNGKQMSIMWIVVSADGRTLTLTQTGKNAAGQGVHNTFVYDKQ